MWAIEKIRIATVLYKLPVEYFKASIFSMNRSKSEILPVPGNSKEDIDVYIMLEGGNQVNILGLRFSRKINLKNGMSTLAYMVGMGTKGYNNSLNMPTSIKVN